MINQHDPTTRFDRAFDLWMEKLIEEGYTLEQAEKLAYKKTEEYENEIRTKSYVSFID